MNCRGLTLAEVLLAIGLCVVVVLSAVALSISALRSNDKSVDLTAAHAYGGQVLEEFIDGLPASSDPFWQQSSFASPYLQDTATLGRTEYRARLYLAPVAGAAGLLHCSVNVTWKGGQAGHGLQLTELSRMLYAP